MNINDKRSFNTKHLLNLIKTIEFTVKTTSPEADACEVYDTAIMAISAMGADIARHSQNPKQAAIQFGDALTGNIIQMLKMSENK